MTSYCLSIGDPPTEHRRTAKCPDGERALVTVGTVLDRSARRQRFCIIDIELCRVENSLRKAHPRLVNKRFVLPQTIKLLKEFKGLILLHLMKCAWPEVLGVDGQNFLARDRVIRVRQQHKP